MTFPDNLEHLVDLYQEIYLITDNKSETQQENTSKQSVDDSVKCVVLLDDALADQEKELLSKILGAVAMGFDDVGHDIKSAGPNIPVVHFNSQSEEPYYTVLSKAGRKILYAHGLSVLKDDVNLKRQLWAGLKQLFEV